MTPWVLLSTLSGLIISFQLVVLIPQGLCNTHGLVYRPEGQTLILQGYYIVASAVMPQTKHSSFVRYVIDVLSEKLMTLTSSL